jgi:hypothetical protein
VCQAVIQDLEHFFSYERDRPSEEIQHFRQEIRMIALIILLDGHIAIIQEEDTCFVGIVVTVIGGRKYGNHKRERVFPVPSMHFIPFNLNLMRSHD